MKKKIVSVFLSLFTICSLGIPSIALATPTNLDYTHNTLTYLEKEELRTEFNMYGVDKSTSEQLIKKFESGQLWDSLSPDSTPKSNKVIRSDNTITTLYEYNDGSIKVTTVPDFVALESEKYQILKNQLMVVSIDNREALVIGRIATRL